MIQFPLYNPTSTYYQRPCVVPPPPVPILPESPSLEYIHANIYPELTTDEFYADETTRNNMLYNRGKFEILAKYGNYNDNCGEIYNRLKDNQDFKKLVSSKYLNNPQSFIRIIKNLKSLETQRKERLTVYPVQYYGVNTQMYISPVNYQKYDMPDYLKFLNNFVKNKTISDDLKKYFLYMKSDKIDLYYTKLDKINENSNLFEILTEKIPLINE